MRADLLIAITESLQNSGIQAELITDGSDVPAFVLHKTYDGFAKVEINDGYLHWYMPGVCHRYELANPADFDRFCTMIHIDKYYRRHDRIDPLYNAIHWDEYDRT